MRVPAERERIHLLSLWSGFLLIILRILFVLGQSNRLFGSFLCVLFLAIARTLLAIDEERKKLSRGASRGRTQFNYSLHFLKRKVLVVIHTKSMRHRTARHQFAIFLARVVHVAAENLLPTRFVLVLDCISLLLSTHC